MFYLPRSRKEVTSPSFSVLRMFKCQMVPTTGQHDISLVIRLVLTHRQDHDHDITQDVRDDQRLEEGDLVPACSRGGNSEVELGRDRCTNKDIGQEVSYSPHHGVDNDNVDPEQHIRILEDASIEEKHAELGEEKGRDVDGDGGEGELEGVSHTVPLG
jgi:hypothetical protein